MDLKTRQMRVECLSAAGVQTRLSLSGDGPPVLFLHGNPDTAHLWQPIIRRLASRFTCLAPDLPGFGGSRAPAEFGCTGPEMARWVEELLQAAGVNEPAGLVLHDFGGPYGLSFAVRQPEKIRAAACINTLFHTDYQWHFWARVWRRPVLGELAMAAMNRWMFTREMLRGSKKLDKEHIHKVYARLTPETRKMVLKLYRATDPENFPEGEKGLKNLAKHAPILVLWGARDPYIPERFADRFHALEVVRFPGAGHWLPAEEPGKTSDRLEDFLSRAFSPGNEPDQGLA